MLCQIKFSLNSWSYALRDINALISLDPKDQHLMCPECSAGELVIVLKLAKSPSEEAEERALIWQVQNRTINILPTNNLRIFES